ncbi:hypothetical protein H6F46_14490 [Limnothrix sp. FACHB-1083]|nr:hypothetical protein [Limnothrix sp. FACHB-1083]MBD2161901.1 hypothetical protein [Limnothrix sp. FACHB-1083]
MVDRADWGAMLRAPLLPIDKDSRAVYHTPPRGCPIARILPIAPMP